MSKLLFFLGRNAVSILLGMALLVVCLLYVKDCSNKNSKIDQLLSNLLTTSQRAISYKDSMQQERITRRDCELDFAKQKGIIFSLKQNALKREAELQKTFAGLTQTQQRIDALKSLVKNGTLPQNRLSDTLTIVRVDTVKADSALVAAVGLTARWLEAVKLERDSAYLAGTALVVENQNMTQRVTNLNKQVTELTVTVRNLSAPCTGFFAFVKEIFCPPCRESRRLLRKLKRDA